MNIIFMGTPDFALPALKTLINSEHIIGAVYTAPAKKRGRGMKLQNTPIADLALDNNIPVYTPAKLRDPDIIEEIHNIEADIIVVVAYGQIVPKDVLESKKYGCLNIHPSKLPKYRGAAPLQRTVINGDNQTAVCIMQMDEGLDTGDVVLRHDFAIGKDIKLVDLHDQCAKIGAELLLETLTGIETLPRIQQVQEGMSYAHKLTKEEGEIDWNKSAFAIDCLIRGMNPWPGAYFFHNDQMIKIIEAEVLSDKNHKKPGVQLDSKHFDMVCSDAVIRIKKLKVAGKPYISGQDYINSQKSK